MNTRSTFQFLRIALGIVLLCSLVLNDIDPASAALRCYVKWNATGLNTGASWENAFTDLQSVLGSVPCTEVWVAAGSYRPTSTADRTVSFVLKSGVAIYGGFVGTETLRTQRNPAANLTILSGDIGVSGNADNSYHVVVGSNTDSTARLDGFTITAGNANTSTFPDNSGAGLFSSAGNPRLVNLIFSDNSATGIGGGIFNLQSNPSLTNVTFSGNSASFGGGMTNGSSGPSLTNVTFSNNSANSGGGMHNDASNPDLANVTFSGNSATNAGGGIYNDTSSPSLTNVTFSDNSAYNGGGMSNAYSSSPSLTSVIFSGNSATTGGGMYNDASNPSLANVTFSGNSATSWSGGMQNDNSSPSLTNVTFSGNSATVGGGMCNLNSSSPSLMNVTFSGNSATAHGGMYNYANSSPIITNSILYGNAGGEIFNNDSSSAMVNHSIVQGGYAGTGNLNANPLLGPLANNGGFTQTRALGAGSPAIDKGTNAGCPPRDQRGIARPQDGDGNGAAVCDMGAYESPGMLGLFSAGAQDGWVLESTETSGVGGTMDASQETISVGDYSAAKKQARGTLSFNTAGLPDNAAITSVTLRLKGAGVVGANPFSVLGNLLVDVRKGAFSNNAMLQLGDFQAPASKNGALTIKNTPLGGWYSGIMGTASYVYINKTGITQFRLRFAKDDNNDLLSNYIRFYSGNCPVIGKCLAVDRPKLIIKYYLP